MKLIFDAMLSANLATRVGDIFPNSTHVEHVGLQSSDQLIWDYAGQQGFIVVTKDNDFQWRAEVQGPPPKVIMVRLGNCRTRLVESLIRMSFRDIRAFVADQSAAVLILPLDKTPTDG